MNFGKKEKLESKISITERPGFLEKQDDVLKIGDEKKLEQFRREKIENIGNQVVQFTSAGFSQADDFGRSYELSEQEVFAIRQEIQVDSRLESLSEEVQGLAKNTAEQINQIGQRDFSKKYASLGRDILAAQLRQLRVDLFEARNAGAESIKTKISEREKSADILENGYRQFEKELEQMKNKFLNRWFKREEILQLERDLRDKKATIEEVRKDIEERYELLDEVTGLTGAERDRAEIRKKLNEFYKGQEEISQKFESEESARSIAELSKKEKVFFIHGMPLAGGQQQGSEYNNSFIDGQSTAAKTKLELIIGLAPTLSCSTLKEGDTEGQMAGSGKAGVILGQGRVLFAKERDAYTVTEGSPFIRRSKGSDEEYDPRQSDIQRNPEKNINRAIQHKNEFGRETDGYNEFVVETPEVVGIFFNYKTYKDLPAGMYLEKYGDLKKLAQEFKLPLYAWKDGKMQTCENLNFLEERKEQELSFSDLQEKAPRLSFEEKKKRLENVVKDHPFRMNTKALRMYSAYADGEIAYRLLIKKDLKNSEFIKDFRTNYCIINSIFDEKKNEYIESINSLEKYLQNIDNIINKRGNDAKETITKLAKPGLGYSYARSFIESRREASEDVESIYAQVYAIGETARRNRDAETALIIQVWLVNHEALERMQKFKADRIDEDDQLKFIPEEDIPKEVREKLVDNINTNILRKAA